MAQLLDDWGFRPAPARRQPPRRPAGLWLAAGIGLIAAAVATTMIVVGLRGPQPAPLPPADFSLPAAAVPNPVTGPPPTAATGAAGQQPHPGAAAGGAPAGPSSGQPNRSGQSSRSATAAGSTGPTGSSYTGPTIPDQSRPRPQIPAGPLGGDQLVVPAVGIDAPVLSTGVVDGGLAIPDDVAEVTDWEGSAPITGSAGTVLVAGHIDNIHQGPGAMYPLHLVRPGDAVYLTRGATVTRWKVISLHSVAKPDLPASLFAGNTGPRQLALVTCGGTIAHGSYDDNVIAVAVPF